MDRLQPLLERLHDVGCERDKAGNRTLHMDQYCVLVLLYAKFTLFNKIVAIDSSYVCRIRDNSVFEILEDRPLSNEAQKANILQDAIVSMGKNSKASERPDHRLYADQSVHGPQAHVADLRDDLLLLHRPS